MTDIHFESVNLIQIPIEFPNIILNIIYCITQFLLLVTSIYKDEQRKRDILKMVTVKCICFSAKVAFKINASSPNKQKILSKRFVCLLCSMIEVMSFYELLRSLVDSFNTYFLFGSDYHNTIFIN